MGIFVLSTLLTLSKAKSFKLTYPLFQVVFLAVRSEDFKLHNEPLKLRRQRTVSSKLTNFLSTKKFKFWRHSSLASCTEQFKFLTTGLDSRTWRCSDTLTTDVWWVPFGSYLKKMDFLSQWISRCRALECIFIPVWNVKLPL